MNDELNKKSWLTKELIETDLPLDPEVKAEILTILRTVWNAESISCTHELRYLQNTCKPIYDAYLHDETELWIEGVRKKLLELLPKS